MEKHPTDVSSENNETVRHSCDNDATLSGLVPVLVCLLVALVEFLLIASPASHLLFSVSQYFIHKD